MKTFVLVVAVVVDDGNRKGVISMKLEQQCSTSNTVCLCCVQPLCVGIQRNYPSLFPTLKWLIRATPVTTR